MGAGLALGREGPTVQMGAAIGHFLATALGRSRADVKALLAAAQRLRRWLPGDGLAATVGAAVGLLAWFEPGLVGGGDAITQRALAGGESMIVVAGMFLVRFALGPLSYAAATPGVFAPMLVLGAQCGLFLGALFCYWLPYLGEPPTAFAVVGMAAFFTAVVRAPVTGIILVTEMTGCFTLLLPMLLACFAAMTVPTMLGDPPIYDSLRTPRLRRVAPANDEDGRAAFPGNQDV